jgi:ABC-type transport system involved in multi-copper enzyme maturation permease subunit
MLSTIIFKEIRESLYNYRLLFFLIITVTLIPVGLQVNRTSYSNRLGDYKEQVRSERKAISSADPWNVESGNIPIKGFLEPAPLAVFAQGLEGSLPKFYTFKPGGYEEGTAFQGEKSFAFESGILDFAFIVQLVLSLIALIFGADAVSGEKELGTLRSVLSNSIPRETVLLGKIIGGFVAIWLPFVFAVVVGVSVLGLGSFPLYDGEIVARIFLIMTVSSVFLLIYFLLGIMISSTTSRTRTSLIAVIVVWTFLQLIIPKVGLTAASLVHPIKTETVLSMEKSLAINKDENEKSRALGREYHRIFGTDTLLAFDRGSNAENAEWNLSKTRILRSYGEKETAQIQILDSAYEREKWIQQDIATSLSFISPSASFGDLAADLCGTGSTDRKRFIDAVSRYQKNLDRELFGLVERTPITFVSGQTGYIISVTKLQDTKSLPEFSVKRAGLLEIFSNNIASMVSLALWLIIPFAVTYRRFMRYDVR